MVPQGKCIRNQSLNAAAEDIGKRKAEGKQLCFPQLTSTELSSIYLITIALAIATFP